MDEVRLRMGVKHFVLSRWMQQFPYLRERWVQRQLQQRREVSVKRIETAISTSPGLTRQALMRTCARDIRWLERRERPVLDQLLARIPEDRSRQAKLFRRG